MEGLAAHSVAGSQAEAAKRQRSRSIRRRVKTHLSKGRAAQGKSPEQISATIIHRFWQLSWLALSRKPVCDSNSCSSGVSGNGRLSLSILISLSGTVSLVYQGGDQRVLTFKHG